MTDIKKILSEMTLDEKVGHLMQLNGIQILASEAAITGPDMKMETKDDYTKVLGSVLNFANADEARKLQDAHLEGDPHKIPMLLMMDVIHGYRTIYPIPLALGSSFDPQLVYDCTRVASKEASAAGIHVTFTPMVDYVRDARWGRVMESCGEEPLLNGIMGATQVKAFHGDGINKPGNIATCVKHYAAYGAAEAGRDYCQVELSEHTLREFYLPAYKDCIDAGVDMLMPSFNSVNGVPSTANEWLMQKILKDEWKFEGIVISDYSAVKELVDHGVAADMKEAAKLAFENGCDIEMCSTAYYQHLKELINEGVFTEAQLDEAVLKILKLKNELGLFEDPYHGASIEAEKEACADPAHRETVRKAAEQCAVLLKNDGILPLSEDLKKIAVIGPLADNHGILGFWSCHGVDAESVTVKQGIENLLPDAEIIYAEGCSNLHGTTDKSGFEAAIKAAKAADAVVLCIGEPQDYSGESNCRADIGLTGVQLELAEEVIAANPNTAVVTFSGRPLALTGLSKIAPAILHMWFPGTEGGNAAANLIFGKANPCGKLSMSFPKAVGQCPLYYNHPHTGRPKETDDDIFVIYQSNYIDCGNLALYPFGYGLSYSDFVYEGLEISSDKLTYDGELKVKITVHNNSNVPGKETVMLYMRDPVASNVRPEQQLIAFDKVYFEANERKIIEFTVKEDMLRFWNNNNEHVSEKGEFRLSTGYADNLIHTKSFYLI